MLSPPHPQEDARSKKQRHSTVLDIALLPSKAVELHSKPVPRYAPLIMEVAPMNEDLSVSPARLPLNILQLPAETLLQIVAKLSGSNAILNLSRTNRHMHKVTNEAMAKQLVVHDTHLKMAINWLARHPDLIARVNTLDLRTSPIKQNSEGIDTNDMALSDQDFSAEASQVVRNMIWINTQKAIRFNWLLSYQPANNSIWSDSNQLCLDVLSSLCPNIRTLTIRMPAAQDFDKDPARMFANLPTSALPMANPYLEPVPPLQGIALKLMRKTLRSLLIAPDTTWTGPPQRELLLSQDHINWSRIGKHTITLQGFNELEHLEIPMSALGYPQSIQFESTDELQPPKVHILINYSMSGVSMTKSIDLPTKVLPLSLVCLKLRSCNEWTFMFLQMVSCIPAKISNMKRLDLYLDTCARSHILRNLETSTKPLNLVEILSGLEDMGIKVTFYTGADEKFVDMRQELTIFYALRPEEVGLVSLAQRQFSELEMQAISRRRSSRSARRIFIRHALTHFNLFNSSTFNANDWLDSAFFHGVENTKYDPHLGSTTHGFSLTTATGAGRKSKRRNKYIFDMDNFIFTFRAVSIFTPQLSAKNEISFLGKTFALFSRLFPVPKRVINASPAKQYKRESRNSKMWEKKAGKSQKYVAKDQKQTYFPSCPKGIAISKAKSNSIFEGVSWMKEDWKFYLQVHVVATLVN
jgi:hypothetical protein